MIAKNTVTGDVVYRADHGVVVELQVAAQNSSGELRLCFPTYEAQRDARVMSPYTMWDSPAHLNRRTGAWFSRADVFATREEATEAALAWLQEHELKLVERHEAAMEGVRRKRFELASAAAVGPR